MNQVQFSYMLGLDLDSVNPFAARFKNRSIATHRPARAPFSEIKTATEGPSKLSSAQIVNTEAEPSSTPVENFQQVVAPSCLQQDRIDRRESARSHDGPQAAENIRKTTYVHQHFSGRKFAGDLSHFVELLL
eukprot:IDg13029t1